MTTRGSLSLKPPPAAPRPSGRLRRLKLRHVLFLCLLLSGIIPLAISSAVLIRQNRSLLVDRERDYLVRSAEALSYQVDAQLADLRQELESRGKGLLIFIGDSATGPRLREPWVEEYLRSFLGDRDQIDALRVLDLDGVGPRFGRSLEPSESRTLDTAFELARNRLRPVFRVSALAGDDAPRVAVAVPVTADGGASRLIVQALFRLDLASAVLASGQTQDAGILLADADGEVLWTNEVGERLEDAAVRSGLLASFAGSPLSFTRPVHAVVDGEERRLEATVSRVGETSWGVVVLKPMTAAMVAVERMMLNTLLSSLLLVLLALLFAAGVARWVGEPMRRLADTSHEIAAGNFGHRVALDGLTFEMADLAENFNRMSGYVESYVDRLRQAASANRELFIGSIRAFAAAIDAKDPYTRGHSERVAAVSRAIARHLGYEEEFQQRVWLGSLLHDVGKIGVDDRILKKSGLLTPEEFEQMKAHTVVGAEIMGRIDQLKEIIPAIRWHHENWNGRGYPDGIKGEQIPLIARIIAVSDTFDAVTTSRPYQQAYTLDFAVQTITRLAGTRFDAKVVTAFLSAFNAGQVEAAIDRPPVPTVEIQKRVAATT